jgi:hypothetical protein
VKPLPFKMGYSSAHGETNLQLIYWSWGKSDSKKRRTASTSLSQ